MTVLAAHGRGLKRPRHAMPIPQPARGQLAGTRLSTWRPRALRLGLQLPRQTVCGASCLQGPPCSGKGPLRPGGRGGGREGPWRSLRASSSFSWGGGCGGAERMAGSSGRAVCGGGGAAGGFMPIALCAAVACNACMHVCLHYPCSGTGEADWLSACACTPVSHASCSGRRHGARWVVLVRLCVCVWGVAAWAGRRRKLASTRNDEQHTRWPAGNMLHPC